MLRIQDITAISIGHGWLVVLCAEVAGGDFWGHLYSHNYWYRLHLNCAWILAHQVRISTEWSIGAPLSVSNGGLVRQVES